MGKRYTLNHEVAYYECDINQNMTFPALLSVAIKASSDQSDQLERGTEYINTLGITWVITQTEVTIDRLPKVGEQITVVTEPTEFNRYFCYRSFWVYDSEETELLKIDMSFVLMDVENRKMSSVDAKLMAPYESPQVKRFVAGLRSKKLRVNSISYITYVTTILTAIIMSTMPCISIG